MLNGSKCRLMKVGKLCPNYESMQVDDWSKLIH